MAQSQPTMVFTSKRLQPSSRSCPLLKRVVAIAISLCFTRYLFISGFFPVVQAWGVPPSHNRPNGVDLSLTRRVWLKGSLMAMLSSPYVGLLHPVPSAAAVASSIPSGYADISERLTANSLQQIPSSQAFNSRGKIGGERRNLGEAGVALPNLRPQITGHDLLFGG